MRTRKHVKILKHHRNSAVYIDGRYLCVDTKISTRSKRGREIARETVSEILNAVGASEAAFQLTLRMAENSESMDVEIGDYNDGPKLAAGSDPTVIHDPPKPPDSFTEEEGKSALRAVDDENQRPQKRTDEPPGY